MRANPIGFVSQQRDWPNIWQGFLQGQAGVDILAAQIKTVDLFLPVGIRQVGEMAFMPQTGQGKTQ